jgi:spermidine synthase
MRLRATLVYLFFILSGVCGLVYEVVWDRYLMTFIGASTYAHTVVLATFMGGLALGSWLLGRTADRVGNGLRLYAWLEVGIGAYALLFPHIFQSVGELYVLLAREAYPATGPLTAIRFAICCLLLLPPTVAMGGTLPVLTRYLTRTHGELRRRVGFLYFVNSAGAVVGTFVAGFLLLRLLGLPFSLTVAGSFNVLLGIVAWAASRYLPTATDIAPKVSEPGTVPFAYSRTEARVAFAAAGIVGFATMGLEVAWVRFWSLVLGTSTYAFSIMLMAFITGIAVGSLLVSTRLFHRRLTPLLFWVFAGTAMVLLVGLPFYDRVPYWFARIRMGFGETHGDFLAYEAVVYCGCFLSMFVPTVLSGMALPSTIRIVSSTVGRVGRDVGRVYAVNTVGTLLGAVLTGTVLLTLVGLESSFRILFLLFLAGSLAVLPALRKGQRVAAIAALLLLAGGHFLTYSPWNTLLLNQGLYRNSQALFVEESDSFAELEDAYAKSGLRLEAVYEGHSTSVALVRASADNLVMHINGKADASVFDDVTQSMIAHLPLLIHPAPDDVLVVGLGSGYTVASALLHPVGRLDVVELCSEVVDGARHFFPFIGDFLADHRVTLYVDDAIHFLRVSDSRYDVISSEPTNPWQAGAGNLFTEEYYALLSDHLKPGGIVLQFIPGYEISDEVIQLLLRTIAGEFAYVELFRVHSNDLLMLASHEPLVPDAAAMAERMADPTLRTHMLRLGVDRLEAVAAMHQTPTVPLRAMLEPGPRNSLTHPIAEYIAPEAFFRYSFPDFPRLADSRFALYPVPGLWWSRIFGSRPANEEVRRSIRTAAEKAGIRRLVAVLDRTFEPADESPCRPDGEPSVDALVTRYSSLRQEFFAAWSVFYHGETACLAELTDALAATDPGRRALWKRERALWRWFDGETEAALDALLEWYAQHNPNKWRADDLDCIRILVAGLLQAGRPEDAAGPVEILRNHQQTPEDRGLVNLATAP